MAGSLGDGEAIAGSASLPKPALPRAALPRRILDALYLGAGYLAALFLVAIFLLMLGLSLGRQVGLNIPSGDDFTSWCMAAMAFLGLAHTFKDGEMIRVGILVDKLSGRKKTVAEVFSLGVGVVFIGYFAFYATRMTIESWQVNDISQGVVSVPLWIPQLGYSGGLVLLAIAFLDELIRVLGGYRPTYEKDPPKTAEELVERAASSAV